MRRLFFGASTAAPWPKDFPRARLIPEETRHITLAFLGQDDRILSLLPSIPLPPFQIGPAGIGNKSIFLPEEKSRVVALSVQWLTEEDPLALYQRKLSEWLATQGYSLDERPFFPHITLGRAPFEKQEWEEQFSPLPFFVRAIHLYESLGNLDYRSLWEHPCLAPFDELDHTADIAFLIRGTSLEQLHLHAQLALSFKDPRLVEFVSRQKVDSLDEIIISLNALIARADIAFGSPFKAVSFHGSVQSDAQNILHWEMIVDV